MENVIKLQRMVQNPLTLASFGVFEKVFATGAWQTAYNAMVSLKTSFSWHDTPIDFVSTNQPTDDDKIATFQPPLMPSESIK